MGSPEESRKLLQSVSPEDLIAELQNRRLSLEQIDCLNVLVKTKAGEARVGISDLNQPGFGLQEVIEPITSLDIEAKKWVEVIRAKGEGCVIAKARKGWLIDGKPVEQLTNVDVSYYSSGDYHIFGVFGAEKIKLNTSWYAHNSSSVPGGGSEPAVVVEESFPEPRSKKANSPRQMYEFNFFMEQMNPDLDRRGCSVRFLFTLSLDEGREYLQQVKNNPDLIEATFQQMYPGFTGENQVQRSSTEQAHLVEVSYPSSYRPEIKIGTLRFSHPIGEIKR